VGGAMVLLNPEYIKFMWTDPTAIQLSWYGLVMIIVGVFWLRKVIRIRI
jgi:tight adherence protein B